MTSPVDRLRACIERADAESDAMAVAYLARRDQQALTEAAAVDPSLPLAGEVLAVKACFDVEGWTTHAGSAVLADAAVATADAPMVEQLRSAGAILLAQTNMTEFAYGALGLNSTYGTPTTPLCPGDDRVAGGSTSGGAVAVALGAADIALGSDTSGSIRIPAAFVGAAGFKPSQGRYPTGGMIPLSTSFDAPGIITTTGGDLPKGRRCDHSPRNASIHTCDRRAPADRRRRRDRSRSRGHRGDRPLRRRPRPTDSGRSDDHEDRYADAHRSHHCSARRLGHCRRGLRLAPRFDCRAARHV